jgi:hypothetical protein
MSLLPTVGKPGVEVTGWPGRKIHQQLHEIEMRVHVMPAAAAGQTGQDRRGSPAARVADEQRVFAIEDHAPRLPSAPRSFSCLKRSKHKTSSFSAMLSRAVYWQTWTTPGRIPLMDPNLISKVMREMGRKGGKKGGKKGAKMRAEALTPEQRSQIARKAAKSRWAKTKKKTKKAAKVRGIVESSFLN